MVDERFIPVPAVRSAALICRELLAAARVLLRRTRRDRTKVADEYDRGIWTAVLREERWTQSTSVEQFLNPAGDGWRTCKIANRYVRARNADYYQFRREQIARLLAAHAADEQELVELGCGYGANLFGLAVEHRWPHLFGLDVSTAGIAAGNRIAQHFGLQHRITFERADITDPSDLGLALIRDRVVFSHYCFEQLPYDIQPVIRNLIDAGVRRVIHIEPVAELLKWYLPKDLVNYAYILRCDYQRTLLTTLRKLEREGDLRITAVRRLLYAPSIRHDPAVIVWEPTLQFHNGSAR